MLILGLICSDTAALGDGSGEFQTVLFSHCSNVLKEGFLKKLVPKVGIVRNGQSDFQCQSSKSIEE